MELDSYLALLKTQKTLQYDSAHTMIADKMAKLGGLLSVYGDTAKSIPQLVYSNMPIRYYTNYLNVLEQLVAIGNQTFPY